MRRWRRRGSNRRYQGNDRRNTPGDGNFRSHNRGSTSTLQGNSGITHATNVAAGPAQPPAPGPALIAAPTMRYGSSFTGNTNPPTRYISGSTCPYSVTARRQGYIRSTVYGTIPRMPQSIQRQHTGNLYWTENAIVPSPPRLRPCRLGRNVNSEVWRDRYARHGHTSALSPSCSPPTDILTRVRVPLGSALAWSACLLSMNLRLMTAMVMPTPK